MRAALLVDNLQISRWQLEALDVAQESIDLVLVLNCKNTSNKKNYVKNFFFYALNIFTLKNSLTKRVPINLEQTEVINFESIYKGAWQSLPRMEDRWESFGTLREQIQHACIPILKHSGVSDMIAPFVDVSNLWGNIIFDAGGFSKPHTHGSGHTLWSGVYYPKGIDDEGEDLDNFDEEKTIINGWVREDGMLILFDPAYVTKTLITTKFDNKEFYGNDVTVVPRESLLILFHTWMLHMVTPLTKKEKRYSISFGIHKPA